MPKKGPAIRIELPSDEEGNLIYVFVADGANTIKDLLMQKSSAEADQQA